ncbi:MAG: TldD/PmbA family protein [Thermoplasmata archaeon]|nr:TldD/PmbA family protein [Thermoplasmata archaeon]
MRSAEPTGSVGQRVADRLRTEGPWEVFGERIRRFEFHFNGRMVEAIRGPLCVEGYGLRVFRTHGDRIGRGFQASTDFTPEGIAEAVRDADLIAVHSDFPTKHVNLPTTAPQGTVDVVDTKLWEAPLPRLAAYVAGLLAPFDSIKDVVPSFGSVRATLTETSVANSGGLRADYRHTIVALELAVKAFGGPEGAPPGEYWVNQLDRRVDPDHAGDPVAAWCQYARDARRAKAPPNGDLPVVLPPHVLSGILPGVLAFRCTGAARLQEVAPEVGSMLGAQNFTLHDDGRYPWAVNTGPLDDEGTATGSRALIESGKVTGLLYDVLHAGAFEVASTGNAFRGAGFGARDWMRFTYPPGVGASTLVVKPGSGGTDEEIAEAAGEGIWVQQLGWASPDPLSGFFGGEIRIGYRIRNGKIAEPVRGGTVGGTVLGPPAAPSLLANIAAIGSKGTLSDYLSAPTLLVKPLTVAGEAAP